MAQRNWIHGVEEPQREQQSRLLSQQLEVSLREMERWTDEECQRLKMTSVMGSAVDKAWRKVIVRGRKYGILPKHTAVERRFLKMMLKLAVAESPGLVKDIDAVARYLSRDYPFEWSISPCTRLARAEGRAALVAMGESEFGETPLAGPFAFMLYHAKQYAIKSISDTNEVYSHALFWEQRTLFRNKDPEARRSLGLHRHALQRQTAKQEAEAEQAKPEGTEEKKEGTKFARNW
jgi:hypothetical protein